jgi:hypothetical protein
MEGVRMELTMKEKQAVTREYISRYQNATKKAKAALPNEFTRLTGYRRKSAVRFLSHKPVREVLGCGNGGGGGRRSSSRKKTAGQPQKIPKGRG